MKKFICLVLLLGIAGCAKDKDSDQYKDELAQEELAKYQAVEGVYTGLLVKVGKNRTREVLGALEINLKASSQVVNGGGPTGNGIQPILVSTVRVMTNRLLKLNSNSGTFYNGKYDMNFVFRRSDNQEEATFNLSATISGGAMSGHMEVLGYAEEGATFQLTTSGPSLQKLTELHKGEFIPTGSGDAVIGNYLGYVEYLPGKKKKVSMKVTDAATTSTEGLTDLFYTPSERFLQLSWNVISDSEGGNIAGANFSFSKVKWNAMDGTLDVTEAVPGHNNQPYMITFSCTQFYFQKEKYDFPCSYKSSGIHAPVKLFFSSNANKH